MIKRLIAVLALACTSLFFTAQAQVPSPDEAHEIAEEAYIYAYPLESVLFRLNRCGIPKGC